MAEFMKKIINGLFPVKLSNTPAPLLKLGLTPAFKNGFCLVRWNEFHCFIATGNLCQELVLLPAVTQVKQLLTFIGIQHIASFLKLHGPQPFILTAEFPLLIRLEDSPGVPYFSPCTPKAVRAAGDSWAAWTAF